MRSIPANRELSDFGRARTVSDPKNLSFAIKTLWRLVDKAKGACVAGVAIL
jgi:hypothetical protein